MNSVSDESIMDLDKRKYYVQNYDFTMLGYLIDEDEFEVKPAISRVLTFMEADTSLSKSKKINPYENSDSFTQQFLFVTGNTVLNDIVDYTVDMSLDNSDNIDTFDVYINDQYYGSDVNKIIVNTNDTLRIEVVKLDSSQESTISFINKLV
jgi:hypothetical protein